MSTVCYYCVNHGYPCLACYRNSPALYSFRYMNRINTIYAIQKKDIEHIWNNWRIHNSDKIVYIFENNIQNMIGKWYSNNVHPYNIEKLSENERNITKNF